MNELRSQDLVTAGWVAAALVGATGLIAVVVHVAVADDARELLGFTFDGMPRRFGEAVAIFQNNARVLLPVVLACGIVQIARRAPDTGAEHTLARVLVAICDVAIAAGCVINLVLIGAAVGAYGGRTLEATMLHGPLEVGSFSLGLALYVAARRESLQVGRAAASIGLAILGLAIAAVLEVYA